MPVEQVGKGQSYRSLTVWRRAMELNVAVYALTKTLPREETYGLSSQMRRAAVSVISNIAEGHGRGSDGELIRFLSIARGSAFEVEAQLLLCSEIDLGDRKLAMVCQGLCNEVSRMLQAAIRSLKARSARGPEPGTDGVSP